MHGSMIKTSTVILKVLAFLGCCAVQVRCLLPNDKRPKEDKTSNTQRQKPEIPQILHILIIFFVFITYWGVLDQQPNSNSGPTFASQNSFIPSS
jgi:hypothetical protein